MASTKVTVNRLSRTALALALSLFSSRLCVSVPLRVGGGCERGSCRFRTLKCHFILNPVQLPQSFHGDWPRSRKCFSQTALSTLDPSWKCSLPRDPLPCARTEEAPSAAERRPVRRLEVLRRPLAKTEGVASHSVPVLLRASEVKASSVALALFVFSPLREGSAARGKRFGSLPLCL